MVSIIFTMVNKLKMTKESFQAIKENTLFDELIIVADQSTEETLRWLLKIYKDEKVRLILNPQPLGLVKAFNDGLKIARGDWLVILANDIKPTKGWLDVLKFKLEEQPIIGWISAIQMPSMAFTAMASLIKKSVLKQLDYFDEIFNPCIFDDADLIMRLRELNYNPSRCRDSIVIHQGGKTTWGELWEKKNKNLFQEKRKLFQERWGISDFDWNSIPFV